MAVKNVTKKWNELSESEKRATLWKLMDNKVIRFRECVQDEVVIEIIKETKDLDFADKADSIREKIYETCLSIVDSDKKMNLVKRLLKIED